MGAKVVDDRGLQGVQVKLDAAFLSGKRVATVGKLGGTTKKEMVRLIREAGGRLMDRPTSSTEILVVGADQPLLSDWKREVEPDVVDAVAAGAIEVLQETELWQRLGVSEEQPVKQLYTPAMLADLLHVSVRVVRRWHRMGLIKPAKVVMRLPYFDYAEVTTARQLAQWLAEGATVQGIQQQLADLAQLVPGEDGSITQLSIIAEGKRLLLRKAEGLVESTGKCASTSERSTAWVMQLQTIVVQLSHLKLLPQLRSAMFRAKKSRKIHRLRWKRCSSKPTWLKMKIDWMSLPIGIARR